MTAAAPAEAAAAEVIDWPGGKATAAAAATAAAPPLPPTPGDEPVGQKQQQQPVVVQGVVEDAPPSYTAEWLAADALAAAAMLVTTAVAIWQVWLAAATGDGSCARYYQSGLNGKGVPAAIVPRPVARWWLRRRERRRRRDHQRLKGLHHLGHAPRSPSISFSPPHPHPHPPASALSRPNGRVLKWFPWGTFAANVAACALDYACRAGELPLPAGGWGRAALSGVVSGVGGTLSTVSTWVVELQRLMLGYPVDRRGWAYMLWSIGVSLALGLAVFGGAVWGGVGAGA